MIFDDTIEALESELADLNENIIFFSDTICTGDIGCGSNWTWCG